jgi:hypothetical protein
MYQAKRGGKNQIVGYVRRARPLTEPPDHTDDEPPAPTTDRRSGGPRPPAPANPGASSPRRSSSAPDTPAEASPKLSSEALGVRVARAPWDSTSSPAAWETRRLAER